MGCGNTTNMPTGESMLRVPGGNIWYKVTGSGKGLPLVLIHGGPGMSSFYFKAFEELGNDRQVVRYDQLGGGKSDRISDTTLFTVGEFDEIDPAIVKELADKVPGAKYKMFPGSGHITPWDARDESVKVIREFLNSLDSNPALR